MIAASLMIGLFIGGVILINQPRILAQLPNPDSILFELSLFAIVVGPMIMVEILWLGPKLLREAIDTRAFRAEENRRRIERREALMRRY